MNIISIKYQVFGRNTGVTFVRNAVCISVIRNTEIYVAGVNNPVAIAILPYW